MNNVKAYNEMQAQITHTDTARKYRLKCQKRKKETVFQVVVEETDLWINASSDLSQPILNFVHQLRGIIKSYITLHPEFATSLKPLPVPVNAPDIIRNMSLAAAKTDVGPMAAVAGSIAQAVARQFAAQSPDILVENGGDTYLYSTISRTIGLLPDPAQDISLGLKLRAEEFPCSLCASSGRIGHSLSLGQGDLVVVKSRDGALADTAATALANILRAKQDVNKVLAKAKSLHSQGVLGVFAQFDDQLGAWGEIELLSTNS